MRVAVDRDVIESIIKLSGRVMERYERVGFGAAGIVEKLVESVLTKKLMRCGCPYR